MAARQDPLHPDDAAPRRHGLRHIARLDRLSWPNEYFNTGMFADRLKYNAGRNCLRRLQRHRSTKTIRGGLFSFKITDFDLEELELEAGVLMGREVLLLSQPPEFRGPAGPALRGGGKPHHP